MNAHYRNATGALAADVTSIAELWMLRILVPLGGHKTLVSRGGFEDDAVARAVGLGAWLDDDARDFDAAAIRLELRNRHCCAERAADKLAVPATLHVNMARLERLAGLSATDARILEFAAMIHHDRVLDDCADTLGQLNSLKVGDMLATLLALDPAAVRTSLSPHGVLARSGLLSVDRGSTGYLRGKLDLLSSSFADNILGCEADPLALLRGTVSLSAPPTLALADYAHVGDALAILCPYLRQAVAHAQTGVNIFLHGAPGTGKSELARVLAAALDADLFEVASEDADGDPVDGARRLRAYRAAQGFCCQGRALLLFDEVEDVFADGDSMFGRRHTVQQRKAWLNRTLEQNKVPTLWLSNSIRDIDPAFMRRFDVVVELPVPPRAQRERIVRTVCADLLDEPAIQSLARCEQLAPAVVSRAASVVRKVRANVETDGTARALTWLIDQSLQAQGHAPLAQGEAGNLPPQYDVTVLNADTGMAELAEGLRVSRAGRVCLYGPPGTGKTAYARWLAGRLDMPLLHYRASELMSKWLGDSEKNIAAAFDRAERERALLLIDEVDSFLQNRAHARQPWEITMVNELLTSMESFSGIFVASTNLIDGLDPASLRRFDLKVRFDYLKPDQAEALFERYCHTVGLAAPGAPDRWHVRGMHTLTPGDFAAVARQHHFRPLTSPARFVLALQQECALKEQGRARIGFLG